MSGKKSIPTILLLLIAGISFAQEAHQFSLQQTLDYAKKK